MSQNTPNYEQLINDIPDLQDAVRRIAIDTTRDANVLESGSHRLETPTYERNLPDHLSMDIVRDVSNYNMLYKAGTALGSGLMAHHMFETNDGVNQFTMNVNLGRDRIVHTIPRDGEIVTGYTINGTGGSGGQYKRVVDHLASLVSAKA